MSDDLEEIKRRKAAEMQKNIDEQLRQQAEIQQQVEALENFVKGKTCENFLIEGVTSTFIKNDIKDFRKLFNNTDLLYKISEEGPKFIREFINFEEQAAKLKNFMEDVVL